MSSFYLPHKDIYMIHVHGKAIQGFTGDVFYQIPRDAREKQFLPLIKRGLMLNIDEKQRNQLFTKRRLGKTIVA